MIMKTQKAFTIIELLIAVAVLAILVAVALPSMRYTLLNNRITTKTNQFVSVLNYARSEAVIGRRIRIEPLNPAGSKNEWGNGWKVWDDQNGDGTLQEGSNTEVIKEFAFPDDQIEIDGPDEVDVIVYDNRGRPTHSGTFNICLADYQPNSGDPSGRQVEIQPTGRTALVNRDFNCDAS